jgi:hypothetical protein
MFLQDLIELCSKQLGTDLKFDDIYLFIGDVIVPTAGSYQQFIESMHNSDQSMLRSATATKANTDPGIKFYSHNIGYLPISLEFFNKWFWEKIVQAGILEWTLKQFLTDILDLARLSIIGVFGTRLHGTENSSPRILASSVSSKVGDFLTNYHPEDFISTTLLKNAINGSDEHVRGVGTEGVGKTSNIIFIYIPALHKDDIDTTDLAGNDEKGLFTFTVGSNVGLLRKISYKAEDIPGVREARIVNEGGNIPGMFRGVYNSDIDMYGPCFFRPGDLVIINPIFYSKTNPSQAVKQLASQIGLGGVYMILKTDTHVARGEITSKLDARFVNYGRLINTPVHRMTIEQLRAKKYGKK